jgi:hypothetical protein
MEPVKPDYGGASLAGVVPALLGARRPHELPEWVPEPVAGAKAVVLLVLDGLGWQALQDHAPCTAVLRSMTGGPITTVVPSTTPVALTSLTTGTAPARHGITGFRMRQEHTVLNTIRWHQADGRRAPDPTLVQKVDPFLGREVPVVTKAMFRTTGFTVAHLRGGDFRGWVTPSTLVEQVRLAVVGGAAFVYAYYPGVDEVAHAFGLEDAYFPGELRAADALVGTLLDALGHDVAVVVTADHGQVHVGHDGWIGLGPLDPMVEIYAGDGRFRYLHAKRGAAGELFEEAVRRHGGPAGDAWVMTRDQLLEEGWLGPDPLPPARRRVGDVVLAARTAVGFVDPLLPREAELMGAHGSLTPAEMLVPLVAARGRGPRAR